MIRIYSVGVWNADGKENKDNSTALEFTPLEFETSLTPCGCRFIFLLEFTPLEFETIKSKLSNLLVLIRIYSVGVWNADKKAENVAPAQLEFTPLEFETRTNLTQKIAKCN